MGFAIHAITRPLHILGVLWIIVGTLTLPDVALAKVYFYSLTLDGKLVRYDPDADKVEVKPSPAEAHLEPRNPERLGRGQTRILDIARKRIVTGSMRTEAPVLITLQSGTATELILGPAGTVERIEQFVYPRQASRFYVQWRRQSSPVKWNFSCKSLEASVSSG